MGWLTLVGAGISALSQHQQGQEAQAAANTNAAGIEQDAQLKAAKIRKLAMQTRGEARASLAASGVDVNSGTSSLIDSSIQANSEQDVSSAIVSGYRQAGTVRATGQAAATAGNTNAISSVVGGLSSDYGQSALGQAGQYASKWKRAATASSSYGVQ